MKKLIFTLLFFLSLSTTCKAQLTYNKALTYERTQYTTYETTWGGWAHYWGSNDNVGIKMHIHTADPRMSSTTNKLVFFDTDRDLFIDLYCRTLYQTSDEKMKMNIRPLKARTFLQSPRTINIRFITT